MERKERIYLNFARLLPSGYIRHVEKLLVFAGDKADVFYYLGTWMVLSLAVFAGIMAVPWSLYGEVRLKHALFALLGFMLVQLLCYLYVYFKAEDRKERVEDALPDMLQLISADLKAGMTPFQALKASSRKEFGPLKEEIDRATAKSLGTESFSQALNEISLRIKSDVLERSLKLFTTAMKSGGHLAHLLEELGKDIAETRSLKKELVTSTRTYTMFIMFTVIIGMPLLMAISIHFLTILKGLQAKTGTATAGFGLEFLAGEIAISPEFLTRISILLFIITSLLACMLIGVIKEGKATYGFRYSPIVIAGSFAVFYAARHFIGGFLG
ncbi:type II secretion system F family protein [Candidatus Woesearchaeota archaeon]|nr:type II secretion system F family protein [Candidatus Woesearchaeota archaeon]